MGSFPRLDAASVLPDYPKTVAVLGCGVIGLTSALVLQQRGFMVDIIAKDLPPHTTSNKAGAYWFPYNIHPVARVETWARETYVHYDNVLSKDPAAKCRPIPFLDFHNHPADHVQFYESFVRSVRRGNPDEVAPGFKAATVFQTFSIDVDACLTHYVQVFQQRGGRIYRRDVRCIDSVFEGYDIVVNCTGLGSRELFNDKELFAARGQTLLVRDNGHPCVSSIHNENVTYIIPRSGCIVLGGTFQVGDENLLVREKDREEIIERCAAINIKFKKENLDIVCDKVGLRPCRPQVRLEPEYFQSGRKLVIHNYGHGGAGWSTCYGCAYEVTDILEKHLKNAKTPTSKL